MELQCKLVKGTVSKDAFGERISQSGTTPNEWRYEGEQYDQGSGLYDLRARWMDPGVGRFTSRDTFSGTQTDPISLHPYLYAEDDPANLTDPTGQDALANEHGMFLSIAESVWNGLYAGRQPIEDLSVSSKGKTFTKYFERNLKFKWWIQPYHHPYFDSIGGVWTIGYGHNLGTKEPLPKTPNAYWSTSKCNQMFDADISRTAFYVKDALTGVPLYQYEFDAIVDLVFNSGPGTFAGESVFLKSSRAASCVYFDLTALSYQAAGEAILNYHLEGGHLTGRRTDESRLFLTGNYST